MKASAHATLFDPELFQVETENEADDQAGKTLGPSPHQLQAIPRALVKSDVWKGLSPGARDLFRYLLDYSNTRSFKEVWPGVEKIEADLNIDKKTRRRKEIELEAAGLVKIHAPGRTVRKDDGNYFTYKSRCFEFLLISYINADYRAYNKSKNKVIYKPVRNNAAILKQAIEIGKKINFNVNSLLQMKEGMAHLLDEFSKRLKFNGTDDLGRVHVLLHSTIFPPTLAESELPENVVVWQEKKNKDLILSPGETWKGFLKKLDRELERAAMHKNSAPLMQFLEQVEVEKKRKAK